MDPNQVIQATNQADLRSIGMLVSVIVTLVGVIAWVLKSALPKILETYRQDMREVRAEFREELNKFREELTAERESRERIIRVVERIESRLFMEEPAAETVRPQPIKR